MPSPSERTHFSATSVPVAKCRALCTEPHWLCPTPRAKIV